jgi:hypothetical protein
MRSLPPAEAPLVALLGDGKVAEDGLVVDELLLALRLIPKKLKPPPFSLLVVLLVKEFMDVARDPLEAVVASLRSVLVCKEFDDPGTGSNDMPLVPIAAPFPEPSMDGAFGVGEEVDLVLMFDDSLLLPLDDDSFSASGFSPDDLLLSNRPPVRFGYYMRDIGHYKIVCDHAMQGRR